MTMTAPQVSSSAESDEIVGFHPYADKFPMLAAGPLMELVESIKANGLRNPVVLTSDGLILDGRNRHVACQQIGIVTDTVVYEGDDLAEYVIDCNVTRRNMSTGARAMSTALVLDADGRRRDGRWKRGSLDISEFRNNSTWREVVSQAGVVLDYAPELAEPVAKGDIALDAAFKQAEGNRDAERNRLDADERREIEEAEAKTFIEASAPDLAALVGHSLETYAEAQAVWEKRNREQAERIRREKEAAQRKQREHKQAMTDLYSGIARGLQIVGGYGNYDDIPEFMGEFSLTYLDPPQYEREFTVENLNRGIHFLNGLIKWQEKR